ncbi:histidine phosphatase family protein [Hwanghaeella grinnelliae]|uniref:Histidine phosphatase family protein n=1 Tax=Hwanghaeella grinnelliae TaxID=2500179 RepID=A0A3S2ZB35_9PROT|nr:histidine phosphatase family protein [Hwanghaeella grinnelliae]RVU38495.1 histidine phosphatase family protein [Hwanghaeella grinnelliae]
MLTLFLLRHAKSSWSDPILDDYERPLNARGKRSAPVIGAYMEEHRYAPRLILCSGSRRTRETLGLVLPYLHDDADIRLEEAMYAAHDGEALLQRLQALGNGPDKVMLIGHNPAVQDLTTRLCEEGDETDLSRLRQKYPTGALSVIQLDAVNWRDAGSTPGRLIDLALPREILAE